MDSSPISAINVTHVQLVHELRRFVEFDFIIANAGFVPGSFFAGRYAFEVGSLDAEYFGYGYLVR